jgi:hypothetical protein
MMGQPVTRLVDTRVFNKSPSVDALPSYMKDDRGLVNIG